MPGLLDILGDDDQTRLAIGLLAAAAPSTTPMNTAGRLAQAVGYVQSQKDADLAKRFKQAQIDDFNQQAELRKAQAGQLQRRQQMLEQFMNGGQPQAGMGATDQVNNALPPQFQIGAQPAITAIRDGAGGVLGAGSRMPDRAAMAADIALNDGKNLGGWIHDLNKPDIQVTNGYAYDKNRTGPGYLPSFSVSQDGKASLTRIGPDGLPVVSAPQGALETFTAYQNAAERAKAGLDPITISPAGGPPVLTSRLTALGGQQSQQAPQQGGNTIPPNVQRERDAEAIRVMKNELMKPGNTPEDRAGILREIQRMEASQQGQGFPTPMVGGSGQQVAGIPLQSDASKAFAGDIAKRDSEQLDAYRKAAQSSSDTLRTMSNLNALVDSGIYSGMGAEWKMQGGRFIGALTGVQPKNSINSEAFNAEASNLVLDRIKALGANPSNADRQFIEQTVPALSTSKEARAKLIQFIQGKANDQIDLFKRADSYARQNNGLGGFDYNMSEAPKQPQANSKTMTMADVQATAMRSGKTPQEVIQAAKNKGYTIGGQ